MDSVVLHFGYIGDPDLFRPIPIISNDLDGSDQNCRDDPTVVVNRVDKMKTGIVSADCVSLGSLPHMIAL